MGLTSEHNQLLLKLETKNLKMISNSGLETKVL